MFKVRSLKDCLKMMKNVPCPRCKKKFLGVVAYSEPFFILRCRVCRPRVSVFRILVPSIKFFLALCRRP